MNRRLILVKHSLPEIVETLPARAWRLSQEGRARAGRLAERIHSYQPEKIVSSPEPKAVETAQIVATACGLELHLLDDLHEHDRSTVPFLSRPEFENGVQEFFNKPDALVFGRETANQAGERFSSAVTAVLAENQASSTIVIVSHGTVISLFLSRLTGRPAYPIWSDLGLPGYMLVDLQSNKLAAHENIE